MITNLNSSKILERHPALEVCAQDIVTTVNKMISSFESGGKLITFGNGGSSCDAEHFCGELQKGFLLPRKLKEETWKKYSSLDEVLPEKLQEGLPAIALPTQMATISAFNNDVDPSYCFAQQIHVLGNRNDTAFGISTSGNSKNVVHALKVAKAKGVYSIALTGSKESLCSEWADLTIKAPAEIVHHIQEYHLPIYHAICLEIENYFYG